MTSCQHNDPYGALCRRNGARDSVSRLDKVTGGGSGLPAPFIKARYITPAHATGILLLRPKRASGIKQGKGANALGTSRSRSV
jgi:hypothetical protein